MALRSYFRGWAACALLLFSLHCFPAVARFAVCLDRCIGRELVQSMAAGWVAQQRLPCISRAHRQVTRGKVCGVWSLLSLLSCVLVSWFEPEWNQFSVSDFSSLYLLRLRVRFCR